MQSYGKMREKANFLHLFSFFIGVQASKLGVFAFFRMQVTSPKEKLRKNERKGKFLHLFSFFIGVQASKLGVFALFRRFRCRLPFFYFSKRPPFDSKRLFFVSKRPFLFIETIGV